MDSQKNEGKTLKYKFNEDLFQLYEQLLGDIKVENVLKNATNVVTNILNTERATTYFVLEDSQELLSTAMIGNVSRAIRLPISEDSIAGYCALTRKSLFIPDVYQDLSSIAPKLKFDRSWDEVNKFRTRDVMCTPAIFKGEILGVIQVMNSKSGPFRESDMSSLQDISRFIGYVLYHAKLYNDLVTLKSLDKEKAEFMRILVHELRAPVTASKALSSSLLYTNADDPKLAHVLGRIETRMDQLLNLIADILQLSQIKSGLALGEVLECDISAETRTICEPFFEEAETKGLSMTLNFPEIPVYVRIDQKGYYLIVSNLVSNALKYTASGSINVNLRIEDSQALLDVTDTGMGIPEEDIPRLFIEFFRASNARQSQVQGTGVGLAGIKELLERFNGYITLESKEDQGSKFTAHFPLITC
jgi:signal transduction histidine kinase